MTERNPLRPCPECGRPVRVALAPGKGYVVICSGAHLFHCLGDLGGGYSSTEQIAIKSWKEMTEVDDN